MRTTLSDYLRFLLESDDVELISEEELLHRSKQTHTLYKKGKLIRAKSLADLLP